MILMMIAVFSCCYCCFRQYELVVCSHFDRERERETDSGVNEGGYHQPSPTNHLLHHLLLLLLLLRLLTPNSCFFFQFILSISQKKVGGNDHLNHKALLTMMHAQTYVICQVVLHVLSLHRTRRTLSRSVYLSLSTYLCLSVFVRGPWYIWSGYM